MTGRARIKKSTVARAVRDEKSAAKMARSLDSFQNFALKLGIGTDNALSGSNYGFNPVTRIRTMLEWIHRGSWVGGVAVDCVADDMVRAGIEIHDDSDPKIAEAMQKALIKLDISRGVSDTVRWSRLYGGAVGFYMIDGQDPATPLRIDTIGPGQFRGIMVLDRWMVEPSMSVLVAEMGPHLGLPMFYTVTADAPALPRMKIHYTRVVRMEGIRLPYWQRVMENLWGISVLERLYDRMVMFDSATTGAAQLVYKSHLRTISIEGMRELLAAGGPAETALVKYMEMIRRFQSNEGLTLIDKNDLFEVQSGGSLTGISEALMQFGQQLAGALQIPLVRLFGMSPAGLNATGESDLRMYYDGIKQAQERDLRVPYEQILTMVALSENIPLGEEFGFSFVPLWQMTELDKAQVDTADTANVLSAEQSGVIDIGTALKELRQRGRQTGKWTNITDEMIEATEGMMAPMPGEEGVDGEEDGGDDEGESEPAPAKKPAAKPAKKAGDRLRIVTSDTPPPESEEAVEAVA